MADLSAPRGAAQCCSLWAQATARWVVDPRARRQEAAQPKRPVQRRVQGSAAQRCIRCVLLQFIPEAQRLGIHSLRKPTDCGVLCKRKPSFCRTRISVPCLHEKWESCGSGHCWQWASILGVFYLAREGTRRILLAGPHDRLASWIPRYHPVQIHKPGQSPQ